MVSRIRFGLMIVIALLMTTSALAQDDSTELPPTGNIVVVDSAFVRGGPSNDFVSVGALFFGDEVTPVNISEDGQWILIPYSRGSGWVQRNLVRWEEDAALNLLPILAAAITPTPRISITNTPFIPTATPTGNYVNVDDAASAYVRAGPGRGYLRLGQLLPGESIEPVARNQDTTWVMIRFSNDDFTDGFGWLAFELVYWEELDDLEILPIIDPEGELTPTPTFTPSVTPSLTSTPTITPSATQTSLPTETETSLPTETETPLPTETETPLPTETVTPLPTETETPLPTETQTSLPTETETPLPTESETPLPTETETPLPTQTVTPVPTETETPLPTETEAPLPTETQTPLPTETETPLPTETETPLPTDTQVTEVVEAAIIATETATDSPTQTNTPENTPTDIFAIPATSIAEQVTAQAGDVTSVPPNPADLETTVIEEPSSNNLPIEAIVGIVILLIVLAYIWFYWQGLSAVGRYKDGFVVDICPVCQRGHLQVDERPYRTFGVPRVRRTVRCDVCRSVLRETGNRRWRYAVDRIENATMYDRFNGRHVTDADLERLSKTPPVGANAKTSPTFEDTETEE